MMKKLLVSGLAFLSALAFYAQPVFADTATTDTDEVAQSGTATTDASISLTGGEITLLKTPSLKFGAHEITANTQDITIDANNSDNGLSTPITVQNAGQASGWHVTMQVGQFTGDNGHVLKGATLTLTQEQHRVTSYSSISVAPTGITDKVVATAGTSSAPVTVLSAAKDETDPVGVGLWRSYLDSATLHIPAGNVSGNYTSNLTWTLSNAPQ